MSPKNAALRRDAIVERALEIADLEGSQAVTIRRLATEFGVTPMALYWHVPNKDELLAAMGDSFYAGVRLPDGADWVERLRAVTDSLVASLRRHPASAHLALPRILSCDDGRQLSEATFAMLRDAGFSVQQTADIARTALQTAIMLVTQEAGAELDVRAEEREHAVKAKRAALAALPPDRFPNLLACMDCLLETDDEDAYYRFGVDLYVNGVRALHAAQSTV
ncbi:TetR/AcrR family transcriptional regulator [uncultured Jatrophihabitans sp.]|uniref:TetR/AcrR family transcriptional regulator n=1 Tax=uncultured Jatrophihabitans sp. TaxID=1610747 RepID=UPI0035C9AEA3